MDICHRGRRAGVWPLWDMQDTRLLNPGSFDAIVSVQIYKVREMCRKQYEA